MTCVMPSSKPSNPCDALIHTVQTVCCPHPTQAFVEKLAFVFEVEKAEDVKAVFLQVNERAFPRLRVLELQGPDIRTLRLSLPDGFLLLLPQLRSLVVINLEPWEGSSNTGSIEQLGSLTSLAYSMLPYDPEGGPLRLQPCLLRLPDLVSTLMRLHQLDISPVDVSRSTPPPMWPSSLTSLTIGYFPGHGTSATPTSR